MRTRSAAARNPEEDITYSMENTLKQLKEQVEKVCAENAKTEKKVKSLAGHFNVIKAGLLSFYVYMLFTILACTGCNK